MPLTFEVPEEIAVRVAAEDMRETVEGIFRALGFPDADARRSVDVLIYADLRGIDSHGVSNMTPVYVTGVQEGWINPAPALLRTLLRNSRCGRESRLAPAAIIQSSGHRASRAPPSC
jgi:hypothetical protein